MNISKNGIKVVQQRKTSKKRQPLEYALDMIEFYRIVDGIEHSVVVPKISSLRKELKLDGWRVKK